MVPTPNNSVGTLRSPEMVDMTQGDSDDGQQSEVGSHGEVPFEEATKWPKAGQQKVPPKRNQSNASKGHPPTRQWERDSVLLQRSSSRTPEAAAAEASLEVE